MRRLSSAITVGAIILLVCSAPAAAVPMFWAGNGHWYDVVALPSATWDAANADVATKADLGLNWHLATITSQAEQDFVAALLGMPPVGTFEYWAGGFQPAGSPEPAGNWQWVTGEAFGGYTNWGGVGFSEPNNTAPGEAHLALDSRFFSPGGAPWGWNDNDPFIGGVVLGYVAEAPVPEPGTMMLLGAGLAGLAARARRRMRR